MVYTRVTFVTIKAIQSDWHPIIFIGYSTLIKTGSHQNMYLKISLPIYQIIFREVYIISGVLSSCTYIASMQRLPSYHNNITLQLIARVLKFTLLKVIVVITYMYA